MTQQSELSELSLDTEESLFVGLFDPEATQAVHEQFTDEETAHYVQHSTAAELRAHLADDIHPALATLSEQLMRVAAETEQANSQLQASAAGMTIQHGILSGILLAECATKLHELGEECDDTEAKLLALRIESHLGLRPLDDIEEEWELLSEEGGTEEEDEADEPTAGEEG